MAFTRRNVALLLVLTTALGGPVFAAGCGEDESGGTSAPSIEQTEPEAPPTLDQEGPFGEYPYEECDDIDADGIPDGPWDCNDNGIPDEDEDKGFLP